MDRGSLGHSHANSRLKVHLARFCCDCSAAPDRRWRLTLQACRLQACQAGQVEGSGLGDCHRVAPLLPQSLICPACTGLRPKAEDYLQCTSTPTTHCLLAMQHHTTLEHNTHMHMHIYQQDWHFGWKFNALTLALFLLHTHIDHLSSGSLHNQTLICEVNGCLSKVHERKCFNDRFLLSGTPSDRKVTVLVFHVLIPPWLFTHAVSHHSLINYDSTCNDIQRKVDMYG